MLVEVLIEKAAENLGSQKALAEALGVKPANLSAWKSGARKIQPDDLAAIAHLAGMNAMNFLALATLEQARGTPKEKVLQAALGESVQQLGASLLSGSKPQKGGMPDKYNVTLRLTQATVKGKNLLIAWALKSSKQLVAHVAKKKNYAKNQKPAHESIRGFRFTTTSC